MGQNQTSGCVTARADSRHTSYRGVRTRTRELDKWLDQPADRTEPTRDGGGYPLEHLSPTEREAVMARCETCGNDYDKAFQVSMNGRTHTFDSFECAIHALAPTCDNCGIHIVGHGLEKEGTFFCCEHCAEVKGVIGLRDRVGAGGVIETGSHV
jgi:hypothetical protein